MAFTTTPYCTLVDVRNSINSLSTTSATSPDDAFLQQLIVRAQAAIDSYVGYPFQSDGTHGSPATRTYSGNDGIQLFIEQCQEIDSVLEKSQNITTSGGTYVYSFTTADITADVVLRPDYIDATHPGYFLQRITGMPFGEGLQNYTLTGVFGFAAVPADVTLAATLLVAHYYGMRDTYYAAELVQGQQRLKYKQTFPDHVKELLDHYRPQVFLSGNSNNVSQFGV